MTPWGKNWAEIAIMIYENLIKEENAFRSAMLLRANMIILLGSIPNDLVLDVEVIYRWFFETIPFSIEEAETNPLIEDQVL